MKHLFACISVLLILAGLNTTLKAQPQYYNFNAGVGGNSWPFNATGGKDCQIMLLAGAFTTPSPAPAGNITGFSLYLNGTFGPTTYTTLVISMGQTVATAFNGTSFYTGTLTPVYTRASVALSGTANTWMNFTLDTPFPYDPTQSLVIDMAQCGASASGALCTYVNTAGMQRNYSVGGCPFVFSAGATTTYCAGITLGAASIAPTVVTTAATAVTGTTATLNGTVNANGNSTTVTFDYGLTTGYGTTVPGVPSPVTGSSAVAVSAAITGLSPNTTYHCRVNGTNSVGTSNGNDIVFTTGPPPPTVVTTAATGVGLNTATLNGTVNANNGSTTVTFQYGVTVAYGSTIAGVPSPVTGSTVTNVSAAIAALLPNTTYHYRVVGVSAGGTSNGNDMTFTTAGPPIVVTTAASNITTTSAQLNGTVNANTLSTTTSFNWGLTVAYGNNVAGTPLTVTGNTATAVMANISGLVNGNTYHFQCVGVNAGGTTLGNDMSFMAGCTAPAAPGTITGPINVCQGGCGYVYSIAAIPNATSYSWTVPVGGTITAGQGTTSITVCYSPTALYGFVTVAGVGACGAGIPGSLTINVFPPAAPTISGPTAVCQGSTGNIYMTQFGYSNYIWTITGGTITSGQGTYSVHVTWGTSGAQTISVNFNSLNGCPAISPTVYNVTVNALPAPTISGPNNMCVNSGASTYTTQSGFTNYVWTVSSGGTINSGQGTSILSVTWNTAGTQTVGVNYTNALGCAGFNPGSYNVTVNPVPGAAGSITGTSAVCAGATGIAYSVGSITNATAYVWTLPAGATNTNGNLTSTISVDFANNAVSGPITVYGNNVCGNGAVSAPFDVTVTPLPAAAGVITGPASVCAGATGIVYTVPVIAGATGYTWTTPTGVTTTAGSNSNSITVDFGPGATSGNFTVYGSNSCGNGTVSPTLAVTVNPIPATPVVTNTGYLLHSSAATGNQWYFEGALLTGATAQTYDATLSGTGHYWSIVTLLGCASDTSNHQYVITTGIESHSSSVINIYPVPNDGQFNVTINTATAESFSICVYNSLGVKIYSEAKVDVNGTLNKVIDLRPVPKGVYTVIFENSQDQVVKKVVVNK
jgi:hypothetical protein